MVATGREPTSMRVAVVDDDKDTRLCFRDILQSTDRFIFAGEFSNATEALTSIPRLRPNLVLMDICMPGLNGIECTQRLKQSVPYLKIIIITGTHEECWVTDSLRVGADAFLFKPVAADQCLATLRVATHSPFAPASKLFRSETETFGACNLERCGSLSRREQDVMSQLARGRLYKEIAIELRISEALVRKHAHKIYQKFQVQNRSEAMGLWFQWEERLQERAILARSGVSHSKIGSDGNL